MHDYSIEGSSLVQEDGIDLSVPDDKGHDYIGKLNTLKQELHSAEKWFNLATTNFYSAKREFEDARDAVTVAREELRCFREEHEVDINFQERMKDIDYDLVNPENQRDFKKLLETTHYKKEIMLALDLMEAHHQGLNREELKDVLLKLEFPSVESYEIVQCIIEDYYKYSEDLLGVFRI